MSNSFDFCIPTRGTKVPNTPDWLHEIKHDGYRLRLERDGDRVRLITKGGYARSKRYLWFVEAAPNITMSKTGTLPYAAR
jgi:bifunctional non-homologous end joining protein LigD